MADFHFNVRERGGDGGAALVDHGATARGPGWFESSWDLLRGLEVREGLPADVRVSEWLGACLHAVPAPASTLA